MSSNDITAKEAREAAESSSFDTLKATLNGINGDIRSAMSRKKMSLSKIISRENLSPNDIDFIISDLQKREFMVEHSIYEETFYLNIAW